MEGCYRSLFCPESDKIQRGNDKILSAGLAIAQLVLVFNAVRGS